MSILDLIMAAEYLERKEREAEHGYASTMKVPNYDLMSNPMPNGNSRRRAKNKPNTMKAASSQGNRTTHNELEKNRRAHLRHCLEKLKEMVPLGHEASRHTTLGLLTKAKSFIKNLEDKDRKQITQKDQLHREQRYLRRRLEQLNSSGGSSSGSSPSPVSSLSSTSSSLSGGGGSSGANSALMRKRRSVSECSSISVASANSNASNSSLLLSTSESDEVDIMGYNSNQSDTDDHSSIQSLNSDGGVAITTRRMQSLGAITPPMAHMINAYKPYKPTPYAHTMFAATLQPRP